MTANAIEITGLKKTYAATKRADAKEALKGIDLTIPRGSIFGLLGPNGAGKSTLINILAGLVTKSSGQVKIWGFDQDENPRQSRAAIGIMPQEPNLDPFFTPRGSLDVQAGLYGVPRNQRRTDEILELIGLSDKADAYARSLSGGMRRRLLLGKALVHAPQILVLDEPTAGVDISLRNQLWDNVRKLNDDGMTIILTTHYLEEAEAMCDEIAIVNHGEQIVRDTTSNLLSRLDRKTLLITPTTPTDVPELPAEISGRVTSEGALALSYQTGQTKAETVTATSRPTVCRRSRACGNAACFDTCDFAHGCNGLHETGLLRSACVRGKVIKAHIRALRDDQHMHRRLRMDVVERQSVIVLEHCLIRDFTAQNLGKDILVVVVKSHARQSVNRQCGRFHKRCHSSAQAADATASRPSCHRPSDPPVAHVPSDIHP